MRRKWWFLTIAFLALVATSCSPVAYVEKDPAVNLGNYKTYAWVETKATKNEKANHPEAFAMLSVRNAVNEQLQKKGWRLVKNNPDVLLNYDILVEKNVERRDDPVYTRPFIRYYYNPFFRRWGSIYYPSRFMGYDSYDVPVREATLTLNMIDARTDKTVWQGWTKQDTDGPVLSKSEIRNGVKSIFKKFS